MNLGLISRFTQMISSYLPFTASEEVGHEYECIGY